MASYGDDSPIAAIATTPGKSALTLIRCSGKGSVELAGKVFSTPEKLVRAAGNTVLHGWIVRNGVKIDEVLVTVFRSPKSYTGEDGIDISCHGGIAVSRAVTDALTSAGFRDALPGEFTFRGFMNGKIDLTRSESVMELVCAKTARSRENAVNRLSGVLENEINGIKQKLVEALSAVEIFLDYSEDEIGADPDEDAGLLPRKNLALESLDRLRKLAESWQRERIYQEGILAVIAGRPNAGKSSLFNLLLKEERSIVTEAPGTTRDWIEEWISIDGIPVRLADTAGLRESSEPAEKIGVERSRSLLESADLVLYVIDGEVGITGDDREFIAGLDKNANCLIVWNKADVAPLIAPLSSSDKTDGFISISAKTGDNVSGLIAAIGNAIKAVGIDNGTATVGTVAVGTARQKNLIEAAISSLETALCYAEREEPLDLIAPLIRDAVNSLGEITGEVSTADILDTIFSQFCVGK